MKIEAIFLGKGGQGIETMGKILALSAFSEGKEVSSPADYGGEVTGGASKSELVISDEKIIFPGVLEPDVLVLFSDGYEKSVPQTKQGALIFLDDSKELRDSKPLFQVIGEIQSQKELKIIWVPATRIAAELNSSQSANMVMLGAVIAKTGIIKPKSAIGAIREELKGKNPEINEKAFMAGLHNIR